MTTKHEECIAVCNRLLRGEISAVETYKQVIEKFKGEPEIQSLVDIQSEHQTSVEVLHANVLSMGGTPSTDSGAWGDFTVALTKAATLFGEDSAISILQQGEKYGEREYEDALINEAVMIECKAMMRDQLLPKIKQHILRLEEIGKKVP